MKTYLGDNLYTLRRLRGLSQEELAERLGVSRQAVSKWERNEAYPETENLIALSALYGVTLDALVNSPSIEGECALCTDGSKDGSAPVSGGSDEIKSAGTDGGTVKADGSRDTGSIALKAEGGGAVICDGDPLDDSEDEALDGDDATDADGDGRTARTKRSFAVWYSLPYPIIVTIAYLLWGFLAHGWAIGWTLYVTIPVYYSLIDCIVKRRLAPFAYPVFVTFIYLLFGMMFNLWHPLWVIFLTIPVYYPLAAAIDRAISKRT